MTERSDIHKSSIFNLQFRLCRVGCWKRQLASDGNQAFPGKGNLSPEKEELDLLRKENKRLRMEREILKKATAFFAKESQ